MKRNYNSWFALPSPTAFDRLYDGYKICVLSLTAFCTRYFVSYFLFCLIPRDLSAFVSLEKRLESRKKVYEPFSIIPSVACLFSLRFFFWRAAQLPLHCCDIVITWWLPEHPCSVCISAFVHLGLFWARCCLQGSCLARTSKLLGFWTWEEPQPKSHSCHGLRWGVVKSAWVGTARPVERPVHCCTLCCHFVSSDTSRTSVVYRSSVFLFPLSSAVGWWALANKGAWIMRK